MGIARKPTPECDKWVLVGPVTCIGESPKALKVKLANEPAYSWVPKSQLHASENEIVKNGDTGMLVVASWIARDKGWIK